MAEEPKREGEWDVEKGEPISPMEKIQGGVHALRERFARGGFFSLIVFFAIGILFGVSAKMLAARNVTIGYWDYTISSKDVSALDLNAVQQKLVATQKEEAKKQEEELKKAQEEAEKNLPPLPPTPEPPATVPQE